MRSPAWSCDGGHVWSEPLAARVAQPGSEDGASREAGHREDLCAAAAAPASEAPPAAACSEALACSAKRSSLSWACCLRASTRLGRPRGSGSRRQRDCSSSSAAQRAQASTRSSSSRAPRGPSRKPRSGARSAVGRLKFTCGMTAPSWCLTFVVTRPRSPPLDASTSAPPLQPRCTAALLCRMAGRRARAPAATLATWPRVTEARRQGAPGPNSPWPTAQTSAPSGGGPLRHGRGAKAHGRPLEPRACSRATSRKPRETCRTSASKLASRNSPPLPRTWPRPWHIRGGGASRRLCCSSSGLSIQECPVKRWAQVRRCPASETITPDAQLPVASIHKSTTPRLTAVARPCVTTAMPGLASGGPNAATSAACRHCAQWRSSNKAAARCSKGTATLKATVSSDALRSKGAKQATAWAPGPAPLSSSKSTPAPAEASMQRASRRRRPGGEETLDTTPRVTVATTGAAAPKGAAKTRTPAPTQASSGAAAQAAGMAGTKAALPPGGRPSARRTCSRRLPLSRLDALLLQCQPRAASAAKASSAPARRVEATSLAATARLPPARVAKATEILEPAGSSAVVKTNGGH
mmetsp:Transcript_112093/g.347860  ORF Transcript_112093/g.347860 Transcript_112093/m.347860 type:complete len:581 (-) Transcript_112093:208-1950(-)